MSSSLRSTPMIQRISVLVVLILSVTYGEARAQLFDPCPDFAWGTLNELDHFIRSDANCQVQTKGVPTYEWAAADPDLRDGAFVKEFKYVWLDAWARSDGGCMINNWDAYNNVCVLDRVEIRYISKIAIGVKPPSLLQTTYPIYPVTSDGFLDVTAQDVDTRLPLTTQPDYVKELLYGIGTHSFSYQSLLFATYCNIQPQLSPLKQAAVDVVSCRPVWYGPQPRPEHLPPTTINVYIPSTMPALIQPEGSSPADQAIQAWNAQLEGTGVRFTKVASPCGTAGDCVNVSDNYAGGGCAETQPGYIDTNGVITSPS